MTLFKTIIAAANEFSVIYERSVFSYRGSSLRKRLKHERVSSTTRLRALKVGSFSISFFSSPLGRMWGMRPFAFTDSSLPTYAASRQRFCPMSSSSGVTTLAFSKGASETLSCRLAPLTTSDKGTPLSSTNICRLVPFFPPIRRVWPDGFLSKRRFNIRSVGGFPEPGNSFQGIVFGQTTLPDIAKQASFGPLLKFAVNHRRPNPFKFFSRQSVPDNPRAEYIHDSGKIQPIRVFPFSASPWLPGISFFSSRWFVGISGSTRAQNSSEISHVLMRAIPCLRCQSF